MVKTFGKYLKTVHVSEQMKFYFYFLLNITRRLKRGKGLRAKYHLGNSVSKRWGGKKKDSVKWGFSTLLQSAYKGNLDRSTTGRQTCRLLFRTEPKKGNFVRISKKGIAIF